MEASSEQYRSSSSSASSPARYYLPKPGALRRPISFEDSPDWDDIHLATAASASASASINSSAYPSPSPSLPPEPSASGAAACRERKVAGATLVWKELTVSLRDHKRHRYSDRVVKSSNGYALPATLTVIMGPARSGKSTLLRAIAGRLSGAERMYGEVFVNGAKSRLPYGSYGYVDRDDVLIESLTVREMLYYSALLQLPGFLSLKKSIVDDAIAAMSLGDHADKLIGGHCFMKRLPTGERRRVSIARELVMRPHVIFIDEPLYNLDSVSALLLMVTLKKLASTGCTVIFTMYQSSTEVFGLFDRICLLSNGNTLFFGETLACLQHFSNAGFPCPIMQSPSDHFLRAINTDFDRIIAMCKNLQDDQGDFSSVSMDTAVAIRTLEATYKQSADSVAVESMIAKLTEKEGPYIKSKGRANDATRILVLTWRSLLIMSRDWKYYWSRLALYMFIALSIGTIFTDIGHSLSSVMARVSAIFAFVSFIILLSVSGVPAHIDEVKIYSHEETNRHSGTMVFLLGHFLSSIPFLFLVSISSSLVFYFLIGLRNEFSFLMYFVITIFMCLLANEALMMIISYIWLDTYKCTSTLICLYVIMMLVAGYFRMRETLPNSVWNYPLSFISFHTYAVQGLLENEYVGTSFAVGQIRTIPGVQAVRGSYDISSSPNAKWVNLLVLLLMAIGYRILLYILLRLKVRKHARLGNWRSCWQSVHTATAK
ncbi:ABC transporter G family member 3 isoform X1 [Phragmites australis]|uniref:ABC transporter G family member 3 isoform X1 n=1 Tax=Phragmites australis TaxID=29695 RepID=UPI002D786F44|nr:ABC transporter G family member 3 isoform X1 [Phragmites australis]